jgi:hypothetical protein
MKPNRSRRGSVALLGHKPHNVNDTLTAVPLLTFRLAPASTDQALHLRVRRAENLGWLFVLAMITLSSPLADYEDDQAIVIRDLLVLGLVIAAAVAIVVAVSSSRAPRRTHSEWVAEHTTVGDQTVVVVARKLPNPDTRRSRP